MAKVKFLAITVLAAVVVNLVACGSPSDGPKGEDPEQWYANEARKWEEKTKQLEEENDRRKFQTMADLGATVRKLNESLDAAKKDAEDADKLDHAPHSARYPSIFDHRVLRSDKNLSKAKTIRELMERIGKDWELPGIYAGPIDRNRRRKISAALILSAADDALANGDVTRGDALLILADYMTSIFPQLPHTPEDIWTHLPEADFMRDNVSFDEEVKGANTLKFSLSLREVKSAMLKFTSKNPAVLKSVAIPGLDGTLDANLTNVLTVLIATGSKELAKSKWTEENLRKFVQSRPELVGVKSVLDQCLNSLAATQN